LAYALPLQRYEFPRSLLRFSSHRRPRKMLLLRFILPWAWVRLQSMTAPARCSPLSRGSSFHEVLCLSAPHMSGSARHDGGQPIAAFRPQVFATSRRFAPRSTSQACFILLARPGFPFQGFPLSESRIAFRRPLPSCCYRAAHLPLARTTSSRLSFKALLPLKVRCTPPRCYTSRGPMPS
jgi:hypothetical protein